MKTVQLLAFVIICAFTNVLFAQDAKMTLTPVNDFPNIFNRTTGDDDVTIHHQSGGMYFSIDGKYSIGEYLIPSDGVVPDRCALYIDEQHSIVLPCDRCVGFIRVYSELGLDKCLFKYSFLSGVSEKNYEVLCLVGSGELFTIESGEDETQIFDAWFEKIEGVPYIMVTIANNKGFKQSWGVDVESLGSMIPLGEDQYYIYKTFSSPNSKSYFRLETEDDLQTLTYVDSQGKEKTIAGPCKAIYGISAYKDSCYFATMSEKGKTCYYWNNGNLKTLDFVTFFHPEGVKIVKETNGKNTYTIKTKDKQYGPFPLANSLVYSGDYSHWSAVVKQTANSKFCFIIDGKFSQEFDDIMKIHNYVRSDSWHTYARRGNQWYRVDVSWQ